MRLLYFIFTISSFVQIAVSAATASDPGGYSNYESIVRELSSSRYESSKATSDDPFESIRFHAGVGVITSLLSINLPKKLPNSVSLHGFEATVGIDLFSHYWRSDISIRNYDPEKVGLGEISFKEFDLLVIYNDKINSLLEFNLGGGMSARYLNINGDIKETPHRSNTTPASVVTMGLGASITSGFSILGQVSYRSPLVHDTIDDGSLDGSVRVIGHF
ncbi:MAG: hypothetical protein A2Z20_06985 [Bdellovibrionales bacterium RBG_16_40_8]|nr:MAG: hypothetical protein A2Z20_06985 [Bdellovibrionales bacterium RBG_16_40_8]